MERYIDTTFDDPSRLVDSFTGRYAWASNFSGPALTLDGVQYPTREHAFNTLKTLDGLEREHVRTAPTPAEAKRRGRSVTLRDGWDATVRYDVMRQVLDAAFADPRLAAELVGTGDALLIEGNRHHDNHWGEDTCDQHRAVPGGNHLGLMLMALRARLRGDPPQHWPRVAVTGHRPEFFTAEQAQFAQVELDRVVAKLATEHGSRIALSGAARGADTWFATTATRTGLDVWAYVPFPSQVHGWGPEDTEAWERLLAGATRRFVVADRFAKEHYLARNEYLVRDANVLVAVADTAKTTGGTVFTVRKARQAGRPVILIDVRTRSTRMLPAAAPAVP